MIDRPWGTHLRHWLELPNTFRLLDRLSSDDAEFTSWHAGGCRVLACAVKASLTRLRYPGDLSLKILASNGLCLKKPMLGRFMRQKAFLPHKSIRDLKFGTAQITKPWGSSVLRLAQQSDFLYHSKKC